MSNPTPTLHTPALPNYTTLSPAFGRDYKSAAEVKAAFLSGERDFIANTPFGSGTTNIRDGYIHPGTTIQLRYKRLTMVTTVKVTAANIAAAQGVSA